MTGRRRIRSTVLPRSLVRPARQPAPWPQARWRRARRWSPHCGVVPGVTGGSGDDTITVMTWAPENTGATNKPGMPAFAEAYGRWVNAHGGLGGRPLRC